MNKPRNIIVTCISAASAVLAIVPIFYMANIGGQLSEYPAEYVPSIICSILSVVAQVAGILFAKKKYSKILDIIAAVLIGAAFTLYILGGILSLVDFFCGIVMFGDPQQAPWIICFGVVMLLSVILVLATCFLRKETK